MVTAPIARQARYDEDVTDVDLVLVAAEDIE